MKQLIKWVVTFMTLLVGLWQFILTLDDNDIIIILHLNFYVYILFISYILKTV